MDTKFFKGMVPWNKGMKGLRIGPPIGTKRSEEFREKCRARQLGVVFSEQTLKRMSDARKGKRPSDATIAASIKAKKGVAKGPMDHAVKVLISEKAAKQYLEGRFPGPSYFYEGVRMRSDKEVEFAKYLDSKKIGWKYQPIAFKMPNGLHSIPDFGLSNGEFIEVKTLQTEANEDRRKVKMDSFVEAGNILHVVQPPFDSMHLGQNTLWSHIRRQRKHMET